MKNHSTFKKKEASIGKKFFVTMSFFLIAFSVMQSSYLAAQVCCPDFILKDAVEICPVEGACHDDPAGQGDKTLAACKESQHIYTVYPNDPAFTYTWTVTGGTPATFSGNPNAIVWGTGDVGYIKVVISNLAFGGDCLDSITAQICLIDGPEAGFLVDKDTVCENTPIHFTNTSLGGSEYLWDFGDGTTSTMANPPDHSYGAPGTYTVTLTATDMGAGRWVFLDELQIEMLVPCGCSDTIVKTIVVLPGEGPKIETDCCYGTVCPGDSSSFCTPDSCGTYNWFVTGGYISSGAGTNCITVVWDAAYSVPTTVSLETPGCSSAPCDGTTTLHVPVLYPNLPIIGPVTLCQGASGTFSLPVLPGTYYTWTVSGGYSQFNLQDRNTPTVNITFYDAASYTIKCDYDNPLAGCSGTSTFAVDVKPEFSIFFGEETVCEGSTMQYDANGPANWSVFPVGPAIIGSGSSIDILWNSPGTYTITATPVNPANFCNAMAFKNVEVIALPILNSIVGTDSICPGDNYTYSISSDTDGSPFVWTISGGTGTIHSEMGANKDSVIVQFDGTGPWQLEVYQKIEITPGVFCQSLTKTTDVYPFLPPLISGDATVCVDAVETYSAGGSNAGGEFEWTISPSNRGTILSGQGGNTVNIKWHGTPITATLKVTTCTGTDQLFVTILNPPLVPTITPGGPIDYCLPTMPNNLMLSVPAVYVTYQWSLNGVVIGGATGNSYLIPNGMFTGAGAYIFTVEVSNGLCSVSSSILILVGDCGGTGSPPNPIACTIDFSMNPDPACENQPVVFYAIPTIAGFNYDWDFGDGATSFQTPTNHSYSLAGTYNVTLTATLGNICIVDTTKIITVNPVPNCSITATDTIFCPGGFETLTACTGMSGYQWYKDGNVISGANDSTYNVYQHGEYWVEVENAYGCTDTSNKIYMYMHSLPIAKVSGLGHICAYPSSTAGVYLTAFFDTDYTYSWSSNPTVATFSPANSSSTWASLTLPAALPASYEFIVDVTDLTTGCVNSDTICVTFFETPTLSVTQLNICEGIPDTVTPTPIDTANYSYQWNNGAITPTIVASSPGYYSLTITDKANGCSATASAGFIFEKPDLSLFPLGCADICPPDTLHLYIPLPLDAGFGYPGTYPGITWYDNGNYTTPVGYGETFDFPAAVTGNHEFSVVVQNNFGCVDTARVFCLTDNVCCEIIADYTTVPASCLNSADGCISVLLSSSSVGGPFSISQLSPGPGVGLGYPVPDTPFTLCGLLPGWYIFQIISDDGSCEYTFEVYLGYLHEDCCFAEADSSFIHITQNTVYNSDEVWDNKYYIDDGVIVTMDGAMFDITNVDVVFGECAGIEFVNGGYLRANNSVFRPCDIDKSWRGLRFDNPGEFDNIINESTFKNAEVALYFQKGADAVVSNNLFSDCNYGIRVENHNDFNHPISGNRFVTEDFFPDFACQTKYPFVNNNATYGIYSTNSRFLDQVSHNEFINSKGTDWPTTYGIYQLSGGGVFSENTFTDIGTSVYLYGQQYYSSVENNEIEVNLQTIGNFTSIYVVACQGPVIEIVNNELTNNYNQAISFSAIYTYSSTNLSIVGNQVDGFNYGIIDIGSTNHQISSNVINNCHTHGIYVYELPSSKGYITCNTIKMKSFINSFGLVGYNMSSLSEVSSNCISDCYTSMHFYGWSSTGNPPALPLIRNNSLYNYNYVGINVQGCSGNIGTINDPGLNTLWSNNNSATDINSNTSITVADNFGMFNISFPLVQITSNNPYHSTASCAHQIFNMPSQGNLNINYGCDNFNRILDPMTGAGGTYYLSPGYQETLKSSTTQFEHASMILASVDNPGIDLLNGIINITNLTENQNALLMYNFYYRNADYLNAGITLEMFFPANPDELDFKTLAHYDLDVIENGWEVLTAQDIENLKLMIDEESAYANFAISLLNNTSGYRDHILDEPVYTDVVRTDNIKRIENDASYLNIYPNPVSNIAYIEFINNTGGDSKIEVFDINGKLVSDYTMSIVAGGIELDVQQLRGGIYFVTIINSESGFIQKGKLVKIENQ